MTDHKFTDEEVIKALDICAHDKPCGDCPIKCTDCSVVLADCAIALINRQKAEIERLQGYLAIAFDDFQNRTIERVRETTIRFVAIQDYLAKVIEKKDTASHYAPGTEVVTVDVLEHYARELQEGSHETD